ncbi:hypothetical protein NSP_4740 [Nodularia spumigena CCY9414]|jgi:hypothetical protein|nr:hypothetical protein NSP_4740 [Nodularia spumigena CCY9414]
MIGFVGFGNHFSLTESFNYKYWYKYKNINISLDFSGYGTSPPTPLLIKEKGDFD